jgi:hypothetical protein
MVGGAAQQAVSRLRDVLFAENAMRQKGWIDPDGDGIGSAATIGELCGGPPLRGQQPRPAPVLACDVGETVLGPAARSGVYFYTVCLPRVGGGWSARAEPDVDEELAERRFVAYAWPARGTPFDQAFFLDEHENIRTATVAVESARDGAGPDDARGLTCTSALDEAAQRAWTPWRGKKPRPDLPGDRTGAP